MWFAYVLIEMEFMVLWCFHALVIVLLNYFLGEFESTLQLMGFKLPPTFKFMNGGYLNLYFVHNFMIQTNLV